MVIGFSDCTILFSETAPERSDAIGKSSLLRNVSTVASLFTQSHGTFSPASHRTRHFLLSVKHVSFRPSRGVGNPRPHKMPLETGQPCRRIMLRHFNYPLQVSRVLPEPEGFTYANCNGFYHFKELRRVSSAETSNDIRHATKIKFQLKRKCSFEPVFYKQNSDAVSFKPLPCSIVVVT